MEVWLLNAICLKKKKLIGFTWKYGFYKRILLLHANFRGIYVIWICKVSRKEKLFQRQSKWLYFNEFSMSLPQKAHECVLLNKQGHFWPLECKTVVLIRIFWLAVVWHLPVRAVCAKVSLSCCHCGQCQVPESRTSSCSLLLPQRHQCKCKNNDTFEINISPMQAFTFYMKVLMKSKFTLFTLLVHIASLEVNLWKSIHWKKKNQNLNSCFRSGMAFLLWWNLFDCLGRVSLIMHI